MDRARVICPSISAAAHVTGATILSLALLVLPERLPERAICDPVGPWYGPRVDLGRAPAGGSGGGLARPRVSPPPRPLVPAIVPPIEIGSTLDLGAKGGIEGLPDDGLDRDGRGLCLVDCGGPTVPPEVEPKLPVIEDTHPPVRIQQGGDLRAPVKVHDVAPVYPPLALAARVQGRVRLDCVIDERGRVTSVTVVQAHPLLEAAAVAAVREWRYSPTLLNGQVVSVLLEVTVDFRLR